MTYNSNEIIGRLRYIIDEMHMTQNEFAQHIGIDSSNLSKYLNGRLPINESLINRIVVNLGLSKTWLETGEDLPYAKQQLAMPSHTTVDGRISNEPEYDDDDDDYAEGIPVYDIDVTAGMIPRDMMFVNENIIGYINLPNMLQDCRIVRVSGDSMSPVIRSGDMLAVRELSDIQDIFWGQIYVVLLEDYCMVKYVRRHNDPTKVILRSENPDYDDMEIDRDKIRELMFVQNIIHIDTRM
ncbi:MAG TPA: LexA family transcriptional regulator [Candidatus Avimuribaculum pullicola]|nr:LexA family transcriptional regulator [Candidatus Avimuribaculum pullicola]